MFSFKDQRYQDLSINQSETTFKVARVDYWSGVCDSELSNATIHSSHLEYASDVQELVLSYSCDDIRYKGFADFSCTCEFFPESEKLSTVTLHVSQSAAANIMPNSSSDSVAAALNDGFFGLIWDANNNLCEQCRSSGGQCGYNNKSAHFTCYCKDGPNPSNICGVPPSFSADNDDQQYLDCSQTFQCGNLQHIGYPFWGPSRPQYCGLDCSRDNAIISFNNQNYRVLSINQSETTLKVTRDDHWTVTVHVSQSAAANLAPNSSAKSVVAALSDDFGLMWDATNSLCEQCRASGGQCGYNNKSAHFTCYCKDGPNLSNICGGPSSPPPGSSPPSPGSSSLSRDWIIAVLPAVAFLSFLVAYLPPCKVQIQTHYYHHKSSPREQISAPKPSFPNQPISPSLPTHGHNQITISPPYPSLPHLLYLQSNPCSAHLPPTQNHRGRSYLTDLTATITLSFLQSIPCTTNTSTVSQSQNQHLASTKHQLSPSLPQTPKL
ncbi:hypothetical protein M0R45_001271 [Rubus argutus]|uniref:Wall-associated receptor kinase C-terminal domain-containing protein n=1 Tax=Rubus argutus TaxID=59490 RepID=A0AAW1VM84_RUBAR